MKIYINNLNLDLLKDISELFKEQLVHSERFIMLYTNEGIYHIDDKKIFYLDTCDKEIKMLDNYYNNFTLIIDPSFFHKNSCSSIQGETHQCSHIQKNTYQFSKSSNISMIIEYSSYPNEELTSSDLYFETNVDIDVNDLFIKKELIEFLSVLN
jgi:hypothetical protein